MIELFEKYDQLTGYISVQQVKSMNLYKLFHANNDQIVAAEHFINNINNLHGPNHSLILPDFIKYASLIIHPLIKDNIFKKILYLNFKIGTYYDDSTNIENIDNKENDDKDNDDDDNNILQIQQQQQPEDK